MNNDKDVIMDGMMSFVDSHFGLGPNGYDGKPRSRGSIAAYVRAMARSKDKCGPCFKAAARHLRDECESYDRVHRTDDGAMLMEMVEKAYSLSIAPSSVLCTLS